MDVDFAGTPTSIRRQISLVIPAWNEELVIVQAMNEAIASLSRIASEFEVIVVDDGSTDDTAELCRRFSSIDPRIRLIKQPRNMGYGAALKTGFAAAQFELVAFTDADCQFQLDDLAYMLPLAERYDVVSGYRVDRQDPALRRFCSWGYNTLIQALLGSRVRDIDCALKIFHRDQLCAIEPEANGFFANTEMSTLARQQGLSVVEVGVRHRRRAAGASKVSLREIPRTLGHLLPYWWQNVMFSNGACGNEVEANSERFWPAVSLLVAVAATLLLPHLSYPLTEPDEGRYAEIPREMLRTGDWIVPHFQGEPYLDKPPLFYWLCALSYKVFGLHDWAARLVPATAALMTVLMTYTFGVRMLGRNGAFLGTMVLTLSSGFLSCGRFLILDGLLTMFVVASLFAAHRAFGERRWRGGWWILSAMACGCAVMTKGPIGLILLVPPVVAHAWLCGEQVRLPLSKWVMYGAIVFAICSPWFAMLMWRQPEFARYFFWEHNISRFIAGSFHDEPFWYYGPVLFLGLMPWGLLLVPLAGFLFRRSEQVRAIRPRPLGFLLLWAVSCIGFFSVSRGKLPPYVLPAFPAIALMIGCLLDRTCSPFALRTAEFLRAKRLFRTGTLLLCVAGSVLAFIAVALGLFSWHEAAFHLCGWGTVFVAVWFLRPFLSPRSLWTSFCVGAFVIGIVSMQGLLPTWARQHEIVSDDAALRSELHDVRSSIVCVGDRWGSVPFYLDRNDIKMVGDLHSEELRLWLEKHPAAICYINDRYSLAEIREAIPATMVFAELSRNPKSIVIRVSRRDRS